MAFHGRTSAVLSVGRLLGAAAGGALGGLALSGGATASTVHEALLVACGIWGLAALTLPWTRSRRWPALEAVRLALWAIALGLATALAERLGGSAPVADPTMALLGALLGALVAFVTRRLASRPKGHQMGGRSRPDRVPSR